MEKRVTSSSCFPNNSEKKGELTSSQIVITILAIAGFVIVLIVLLTIINIEEQSEEEICKLSVLTRATAPKEAQATLPLKCYTQKICLTQGDKNCKQFIGEENVRYVPLPSGNPAAAAKIIEQTSADAMLNCWNMIGQGKLSLFNGRENNFVTNLAANYFSVGGIQPMCVICSRVALSEDLKKDNDTLSIVDITKFMRTNQISTGQTYLQAMGLDKQVTSFPSDFSNTLKNTADANKTYTDEMAYIFSQILTEEDPSEAALGAGVNTGVAIGGGLLLTPVGKVVPMPITAITSLLGGLISGSLAYLEADANQGLASIYCGKFVANEEEAKHGCSIVSPVDYNNIANINRLCAGGFEGFP